MVAQIGCPKFVATRPQTQQQMEKAEMPPFTPKPSDVQELIAAITKIEQKEASHVDELHQPGFSPTREIWRLSKVLDSIANLCVSETNHEVIATALRVR